MTHTKQTEVALSKLILHPENVRAQSPETYEGEDIAGLAASIKAVGLINALTVQKIDNGKYGVLAGGRRLAALLALVAAKDLKPGTKIACTELPANFDATTALSFAENDTFRAMSPIDEYDAFAKMMGEGMSPEAIAKVVGQTEAKIRGRLKFALVAPDLREAARTKEITLDVMQAFAGHPDHDVQMEVYEALKASDQVHQAWTIRDALKNRGVKVSDALGQLVFDTYEERGGEIAGDLILEHSVLSDTDLVNTILLEKLEEAADATRKEHGFAWAEVRETYDWQELQSFGRVYPSEIEPSAEAQDRLTAITDRLNDIEGMLEDENEAITFEQEQALDEEHEALTDEAQALQEAYSDEDLAKSGVLAYWGHGKINVTIGLVRAEDMAHQKKQTSAGEDSHDEAIELSASLKSDLAVERAIALGAALCANHLLAEDLMRFKMVCDIFQRVPCSYRLSVSASHADRPHAKGDEIDATAKDAMETFKDGLDLAFLEAETTLDAFEAFRALTPAKKAKIVAYAMAQTIRPQLAQDNDRDLFGQLEPVIMPNVRDYWQPTGGAFFGRLKKDVLVNIVKTDLGMPDEAMNLAGGKKSDATDFLDRLFAEPFATLSDAQRVAVAVWAPEGMQSVGGPSVENTIPHDNQIDVKIAAE